MFSALLLLSRPFGFLLFVVAVLSSGLAGSQQAKPPGDATCPDTASSSGNYTNHSYGFAIVIPKNVKGFWNSAACVPGPDGCICMSDHGRIIPLGPDPHQPERHIEVFASHAADLDEPTVQQAVNKHLDWIRARGTSVSVLKQSNLLLAGLKARRVLARYVDKERNISMIEDFVEALRHGDIEYSIYLRTRDEDYTQDLNVFESIVNSFRLTQRD